MSETNPPAEATLRRFLEPTGRAAGELPEFAREAAALIPLYRAMVRTRVLDTKMVALQRTGQLGTYGPSLGQEAVGVGVASAMAPEDVLLPSPRESAAQLWRGVGLVEYLLYWGGDERGSDFAGPREDFPICVPVGTHAPHAVGVAYAFKLRGEPRVAVCLLGDGATSKGDFAEALNMAGVLRVPAVFVVTNNQWAISVPIERQTAAPSLAHKALAAGIPGERVDGNDVIAVREAAERALERARAGEGAGLIEAVTYRLGDHNTADDATRYRDPAEVSPHWKADPVARLRAHLAGAGAWTKADEEALLKACAQEVESAVETYEATEPQPPEAMLDYLYATLPAPLARRGGGDDDG